MAPLIDMVFLLLIFFMLTAHFMEETGIKLELPHSKVAGQSRPRPVVVLINAEGQIFVDHTKVGQEDLRKVLYIRLADTKEKEVIVKSDRNCRVQTLVSVMDEVRLAGAKGVLLSASTTEGTEK